VQHAVSTGAEASSKPRLPVLPALQQPAARQGPSAAAAPPRSAGARPPAASALALGARGSAKAVAAKATIPLADLLRGLMGVAATSATPADAGPRQPRSSGGGRSGGACLAPAPSAREAALLDSLQHLDQRLIQRGKRLVAELQLADAEGGADASAAGPAVGAPAAAARAPAPARPAPSKSAVPAARLLPGTAAGAARGGALVPSRGVRSVPASACGRAAAAAAHAAGAAAPGAMRALPGMEDRQQEALRQSLDRLDVQLAALKRKLPGEGRGGGGSEGNGGC
jgi:hypothetical protein